MDILTNRSAPPQPPRKLPRRDPVFILMVAAMVLALVSSIALRVYLPNAGPTGAKAADAPTDADTLDSLPANAHFVKKVTP